MFKRDQKVIFYQVSKEKYKGDNIPSFIDKSMSQFIGTIGTIEMIAPFNLDFYAVRFEIDILKLPWFIYKGDLKSLRELKLERIMK